MADSPKEKLCSACEKSVIEANFSSTQWAKSNDQRRCKDCIQQGKPSRNQVRTGLAETGDSPFIVDDKRKQLFVKVTIGNPVNNMQFQTPIPLHVDCGCSSNGITLQQAKSLGLKVLPNDFGTSKLANGRFQVSPIVLVNFTVVIGGVKTTKLVASQVLPDGATPLFGVIALQRFGYAVDMVNYRLIPVENTSGIAHQFFWDFEAHLEEIKSSNSTLTIDQMMKKVEELARQQQTSFLVLDPDTIGKPPPPGSFNKQDWESKSLEDVPDLVDSTTSDDKQAVTAVSNLSLHLAKKSLTTKQALKLLNILCDVYIVIKSDQ